MASDKVSRRHALIQVQGESEFWLVDFGSRNGTYLNSRRITDPKRLQRGDRITIGSFEFVFLLSEPKQPGAAETTVTERTVSYIRETKCWLLVADIVGSTRLVKELPPDEVPVITGRWLAECKQTIEEHGGAALTSSLAMAFSPTGGTARESRSRSRRPCRRCAGCRSRRAPPSAWSRTMGTRRSEAYRLARKNGSRGEKFTAFRMEKLASQLKETQLLSQPAWERLAALVEGRAVGEHVLPGFESKVQMYAF